MSRRGRKISRRFYPRASLHTGQARLAGTSPAFESYKLRRRELGLYRNGGADPTNDGRRETR